MREHKLIKLPFNIGDWILVDDHYINVDRIDIINGYLKFTGEVKSIKDKISKDRSDRIDDLLK